LLATDGGAGSLGGVAVPQLREPRHEQPTQTEDRALLLLTAAGHPEVRLHQMEDGGPEGVVGTARERQPLDQGTRRVPGSGGDLDELRSVPLQARLIGTADARGAKRI